MITEILDNIIEYGSGLNFTIKEFQLGSEPMAIFIKEANEATKHYNITINAVTRYRSVFINEHPSKDAIMFALSVNKIPF